MRNKFGPLPILLFVMLIAGALSSALIQSKDTKEKIAQDAKFLADQPDVAYYGHAADQKPVVEQIAPPEHPDKPVPVSADAHSPGHVTPASAKTFGSDERSPEPSAITSDANSSRRLSESHERSCKDDPSPVVYSQVSDDPPLTDAPDQPQPTDPSKVGWWQFFLANWGAVVSALLVFIEAIVRITPTEKDNSIVNFIKWIFDSLFPNKALAGGAH